MSRTTIDEPPFDLITNCFEKFAGISKTSKTPPKFHKKTPVRDILELHLLGPRVSAAAFADFVAVCTAFAAFATAFASFAAFVDGAVFLCCCCFGAVCTQKKRLLYTKKIASRREWQNSNLDGRINTSMHEDEDKSGGTTIHTAKR